MTRYNLSPKQATALKALARAPWTAEAAQQKLQTTLGALYKRGFICVTADRQFTYVGITEAGEEALKAQAHSDIMRSRGRLDAPFAAVIKELAGFDRERSRAYSEKVGNVVRMRRRSA